MLAQLLRVDCGTVRLEPVYYIGGVACLVEQINYKMLLATGGPREALTCRESREGKKKKIQDLSCRYCACTGGTPHGTLPE